MVMQPRGGREAGEIDVDALVAEHGEQMLRMARRFSECAADAEDAFQRAIEKLLTRPPREPVENISAWLSTVVRNEALTIRRRSRRDLPIDLARPVNEPPAEARSPEESALAGEALAGRREALRRMKPDQLRCMLLRADGLNQNQISEATGFSVAKVQRCLWEGRRAFTAQVASIESGAQCQRIEPLLSAFADGAISAAGRHDVELHIGGCLACRALLRDYRSAPADLAALFPVGIVLAAGARMPRLPARAIDGLQNWIGERVTFLAGGGHAMELTFAKKLAVAAAVTTSVVAGGAGVRHVAQLADGGASAGSSLPISIPAQPPNLPAGAEAEPSASTGEVDGPPPAAAAADLLDAPSAAAAAEQDVRRAAATDPASGLPGDPVDANSESGAGTGEAAPSDAPSDAELLGGGP